MIQPIDFHYFTTAYFWITLAANVVISLFFVIKHGS